VLRPIYRLGTSVLGGAPATCVKSRTNSVPWRAVLGERTARASSWRPQKSHDNCCLSSEPPARGYRSVRDVALVGHQSRVASGGGTGLQRRRLFHPVAAGPRSVRHSCSPSGPELSIHRTPVFFRRGSVVNSSSSDWPPFCCGHGDALKASCPVNAFRPCQSHHPCTHHCYPGAATWRRSPKDRLARGVALSAASRPNPGPAHHAMNDRSSSYMLDSHIRPTDGPVPARSRRSGPARVRPL